MHCASLLRTIFASLARANEHEHVHNEGNIPQESEINVIFLLNEHGDILSSLIKKNKKTFIGQKKGEIVQKNRYSGMQIMTAKTTTMRTLYVHVVLNGVIFWQISYNIVPYARPFIPVKFFS